MICFTYKPPPSPYTHKKSLSILFSYGWIYFSPFTIKSLVLAVIGEYFSLLVRIFCSLFLSRKGKIMLSSVSKVYLIGHILLLCMHKCSLYIQDIIFWRLKNRHFLVFSNYKAIIHILLIAKNRCVMIMCFCITNKIRYIFIFICL